MTIETIFRPIASVDQSDLEFLIPAENDMYIDPNIRLFVRSKLSAPDGKDWKRQISLPQQIFSSTRTSENFR